MHTTPSTAATITLISPAPAFGLPLPALPLQYRAAQPAASPVNHCDGSNHTFGDNSPSSGSSHTGAFGV